MHILLVTDAWYPQVNGVVRTLDTLTGLLRAAGHRISLLTHEGKRTFPLPSYPEIRLAMTSPGAIARQIDEARPDCIHIATEGPLGWFARRHCLKRGFAFTTSFHSRFPEMIAGRLPVPGIESLAYAVLKHFHAPSSATLVPPPPSPADWRALASVTSRCGRAASTHPSSAQLQAACSTDCPVR